MLSRKVRRRSVVCDLLEPRLVLATVPVVVDLLTVYTAAASTQVGGDAHMQSLIQTSVDTMNQALINSNISVTVRLVHAEPIAYSSSGDVFTDRVRLETAGDGYMDGIFALRNQYGADLVALISDGIGGGNADLMTSVSDPNNPNLAFSATFASVIGPGYLTLAHELGHNLGGGHERNNPTQPAVGPFAYSYGYRFAVSTPELTASYNDIMSYAYGSDIPLISYANPNVSFAGVPTGKPAGDPNASDLAATFLQTAPIVANYRTTNVVPDTAAPTAVLFELKRNGASLDFTVRYTDDSGVDLSTIGAGDITVAGPGGFVLTATFVSMDHPTVAGAFKFATYHVTLPATKPATSSLTFNLLGNAIKDIYGRATPAGVITNHTAYYAGYSYAWAQHLGTLTTASHTEFGALTPDVTNAIYSFTLTQPATVSATLVGLTADANLFIATDSNHNGVFDGGGEILTDTGYNEGTADEGVSATLPAGTYYVYVYLPVGTVTTPYTLSVRAYSDTTPPTAVADTKDLKTSGAPYVDFAVTYADDNDVNGVAARYDAGIDIHVVLDNGADFTFYYYPDPNLNGSYANASSKTIYYRIFAFNSGTGFTAGENGTYTLSVHDAGANPRARDAAGNSLPISTIGSFRIAIGSADTTRPTATLSAVPPVPGQAAWTFSVLYKDNVALNTASFDNSDIRVTGPAGYDQPATFVSATPVTNIAGAYLAKYAAPAPGGFWDGTDDGAYTIALQSNQVSDAAGNFALATSFAAVTASSPYLVALTGPTVVSFVGTGGADTMRIDADANFVYFTLNDSLLYFVPKASVPRFNVASLGGDDAIYYQSGTLTGTLSPGTGNNTLAVTGGSLTLDGDVGTGAPLAASVSANGTLALATTQHFTSMSLSGSGRVTVAAGGAKVLVVQSLTTSGTAALDLKDNAAIIDFMGSSPASAVRSMLQTGYAAGAWTGGPGIISSTAATTPNRGIAYADTSVIGTQPFAGQSVDSTAIVLKYTYLGDANLDGRINGDDYALADRGRAKGLNTWVFGDFNYDGVIAAADLALLDRTAAVLAGPPAPAAIVEPAPLAAVTSPVEPTSSESTAPIEPAVTFVSTPPKSSLPASKSTKRKVPAPPKRPKLAPRPKAKPKAKPKPTPVAKVRHGVAPRAIFSSVAIRH